MRPVTKRGWNVVVQQLLLHSADLSHQTMRVCIDSAPQSEMAPILIDFCRSAFAAVAHEKAATERLRYLTLASSHHLNALYQALSALHSVIFSVTTKQFDHGPHGYVDPERGISKKRSDAVSKKLGYRNTEEFRRAISRMVKCISRLRRLSAWKKAATPRLNAEIDLVLFSVIAALWPNVLNPRVLAQLGCVPDQILRHDVDELAEDWHRVMPHLAHAIAGLRSTRHLSPNRRNRDRMAAR